MHDFQIGDIVVPDVNDPFWENSPKSLKMVLEATSGWRITNVVRAGKSTTLSLTPLLRNFPINYMDESSAARLFSENGWFSPPSKVFSFKDEPSVLVKTLRWTADPWVLLPEETDIIETPLF